MPWIFDENRNSIEISSVKDLICSLPDSLYTTMRMKRNGDVFELQMHLERVRANHLDACRIRKRLDDLNQHIPNDLRITLIRNSSSCISENSNSFELIYEKMPPMDLTSCQVEIKLAHRRNVKEKNSQWVKERRELEKAMDSKSNEVILVDEIGKLYEGLSSNLFIIRSDGLLQTAPFEDILIGTVMKKVLEEWKWGPVVYEHAGVDEIETWLGAFITSTSRLILPIHQVLLNGKVIVIPSNEKIEEMRNQFVRALQ